MTARPSAPPTPPSRRPPNSDTHAAHGPSKAARVPPRRPANERVPRARPWRGSKEQSSLVGVRGQSPRRLDGAPPSRQTGGNAMTSSTGAPAGAGQPSGPGVSPLAIPLPELPPLRRVRLGAAAVGLRYQGRTDVVMMEVVARQRGGGRLHLQQVPGRTGGLVPRRAEGAQGAAGGGECRQRQRLHRPCRARGLRGHRRSRGGPGGMPRRARCSSPPPA